MLVSATVRLAGPQDLAWCAGVEDRDVLPDLVKRKLDYGEILVAELRGMRVGYLRLEYLWSKLPYISLIRVNEEVRGRGIGTKMLGFLESMLREKGHEFLMSSSQTDEPRAQSWHRENGFAECGIIAGVNRGGIGEVFFRKRI